MQYYTNTFNSPHLINRLVCIRPHSDESRRIIARPTISIGRTSGKRCILERFTENCLNKTRNDERQNHLVVFFGRYQIGLTTHTTRQWAKLLGIAAHNVRAMYDAERNSFDANQIIGMKRRRRQQWKQARFHCFCVCIPVWVFLLFPFNYV